MSKPPASTITPEEEIARIAALAESGEQITRADENKLRRHLAMLERAAQASRRVHRILSSKEDILDFAMLTMPDLNKPDDPLASRYEPVRHHRAIAAALQKVDAGEWLNLIITMPPRHGKSELASRRFIPWFIGRDPTRSTILATYSDDFAGDFGRDVRSICELPLYREMFPGATLRKGSKSADRLQTEAGGWMFFVGRGGAITGRGADLAIIDDPLKDRAEADSKAVRDSLWKWYNDVLSTRLLSEGGRIVIIMTRWHEDDLVGRLTDPANPHFVEEEAQKWRVLELPALARESDPIGRQVGEALWPARFSAKYLEGIRVRNPRGFSALYQGRPAPEDGDEFRSDWLKGYRPAEYPKAGRAYAASDHALKQGTENDRTCMGVGHVDEDGILYVSADLEWGRFTPDVTVDKMLATMQRHQPLFWWGENDHIGMSLGPFIRKRMMDARIWCVMEPVTVRKDKRIMAQTARAMMQAGMVRFPTFAPWWADAKEELLKFPSAAHDDFVSFISLLCLGVDRMVRAKRVMKLERQEPRTGTIGWVKWQSDQAKKLSTPKFDGF